VRALSAHRAHAALAAFVDECNNDGTDVIITAAGMAAALPGVVASMTVLPVIGVPLKAVATDGMDALLSIVMMPSGVPVATVAINGGKNAAYLALQMMGIKYPELSEKLKAFRKSQEEACLKTNEEIKNKY
jgi:5-(carboxyamino)imidazole ribonucleotide mutase